LVLEAGVEPAKVCTNGCLRRDSTSRGLGVTVYPFRLSPSPLSSWIL